HWLSRTVSWHCLEHCWHNTKASRRSARTQWLNLDPNNTSPRCAFGIERRRFERMLKRSVLAPTSIPAVEDFSSGSDRWERPSKREVSFYDIYLLSPLPASFRKPDSALILQTSQSRTALADPG